MKIKRKKKSQVFSTYVEVILGGYYRARFNEGFLHVCGGDPMHADDDGFLGKFSPRMWR